MIRKDRNRGGLIEDIISIELGNENIYPGDSVLESIPGPSYPAYRHLIDMLDSRTMTHEWRYYRDGKA